jgi:hypothetical protein
VEPGVRIHLSPANSPQFSALSERFIFALERRLGSVSPQVQQAYHDRVLTLPLSYRLLET